MRLRRREFLTTTAGAALASAVTLPPTFAADPLDSDDRQSRENRTPAEVAADLAAVYGHELKTLSYIPSLCVLGRWRWARLAGDRSAEQHCVRLAETFAKRIQPQTIKSGPEMAGLLLYTELARATEGDERRQWVDVARRGADQAIDEQGKPLTAVANHSEMSDSVFMVCPLLAAVGALTEDARYFDACRNHWQHMQQLCRRPDGLYRHSPLCEAAWGRGNAFPALGMTLALDDLPREHAAHSEFCDSAVELLDAIVKHADPMVHQVVDEPDSYREFSATAMCARAAMLLDNIKALAGREGRRYDDFVARSWTELKRRIGRDGTLVDVCEGTGKQRTLQDYFCRKAINGRDDRGGAMALLLATEQMAAEKSKAS